MDGKADCPSSDCVSVIVDLDVRGIARTVTGRWRNEANPMAADTAQRQAGIDSLSSSVDWIIQIDNDELLPEPELLVASIAGAGEARGIEWPMRVLFRRVGDRYLGVAGQDGSPVFEYPGSVAVRAGSTLVDARRVSGPVVRRVVEGDTQSLQLRQELADEETRVEGLTPQQAISSQLLGKVASRDLAQDQELGPRGRSAEHVVLRHALAASTPDLAADARLPPVRPGVVAAPSAGRRTRRPGAARGPPGYTKRLA